MQFKNEEYFQKEHQEAMALLHDNNAQQLRVIGGIASKASFHLLYTFYMMVVDLDCLYSNSEFNFNVFKKFVSREEDAPYDEYLNKLSDTDGISLFIKACIATEGQQGYAPIAFKFLIDYGYRKTLENKVKEHPRFERALSKIDGMLEFMADILPITSPDIAKLHKVLSPFVEFHNYNMANFITDYNNIGGAE